MNWCEYQRIVDALLNKEEARQKFLSALQDDLTDSGPDSTQQKWLNTISQYTSKKCPSKSTLLTQLMLGYP